MHKVYAIIGPPASGKSSIVKSLYDQYEIPALVSHTTRAPKAGERQGIDYYFTDKTEFTQTAFLEKVNYSGAYYGLSKEEVTNKVSSYPVSVVDVSLAGFEQLKRILGERVESIYVLVDKDTILNRYILQGADLEDIKKRLDYAELSGEFNNWQMADHVVKNTGTMANAVRQILAIMDLVSFKKREE